MKTLLLFLETLAYLKPKQVLYQIIYRLYRPSLKNLIAPVKPKEIKIIPPIPKYKSFDGKEFDFLNIKDEFHSWCQTEHGMLWAYNLNYMDLLQQENISSEECEKWIDKFIVDLPLNHIGKDAYTIALRTINWIKFFCKYPECATKGRYDSLYSQVKLLEKKLEWHLMGNHLLEDAYALFISSLYFNDDELYQLATNLLKEQLEEQILPDGAHYEQSPMYHCILLDRLLDCYNFAIHSDLINSKDKLLLQGKAEIMLGHLESIIWEDGSIPLLNDSAYGIAPTAEQLFDYAKRLGLTCNAIPLKECGYRTMKSKRFEVIVDVGNITSTSQPGHSHADTFNYELRIDGKPFIVDTGISTYNKNKRRQYERSSLAHNNVILERKDSSSVWGGFRVGKRAKVIIIKDARDEIIAIHDGYRKVFDCKRRFFMNKYGLTIEDTVSDGVNGVSYLHFAPGIEPYFSDDCNNVTTDQLLIELDGCKKIETIDEFSSTEFNKRMPIKVLVLHFTGRLSYTFLDS